MFVTASAATATAQAISPTRAEYIRKASGMFTLRNKLDVPLVAVVEVRGFSFDEKGNISFTDSPPNLNVEFGSSSFNIAPKDKHYVFYKAESPRTPTWFAIVTTLIPATKIHSNLRVGVVLPHFVCIFQQQKIKSGDIEVQAVPGSHEGEYRLGFKNVSENLARVETINSKGFKKKAQRSGLLVFPGRTRWISMNTGLARPRAEFRIRFLGGYKVKVPLTTIATASIEAAKLEHEVLSWKAK
jgi:hypothetical protein